ncbi:hypothetical protein MCOR25_000736 [Pyricularia grisea]|uniref:Uncharacterized protein n=1 Tax=Pyricularia grisea TaxID=148305 RepID=A0A6P8BD49_PYRGI|nr:uncharacterized protein PgNI_03973 [Pyricularia grisea]KAI6382443.1 hypothetical protein MCOR25_000736 [Pyricularia grisea]TLD13760.1 hypothetical protein PgNI_03973 [Pyricularia grisea]
MKFFSTIILLFAGLASVQAQNSTASATASETEVASQSVTETSSSTTTSASSTATPNLQDLLNNLNGGLNNVGNINFNNRNDVINAIGLLMNQLCVGNFFNGNLIAGLGSNQQLQLLFQLDQLNQLNRLGLLNNFDLQGVFNRGFGGINLGGGVVRGANGLNRGTINFAGFKRAVDDAMAKLDTSPERRSVNVKRQQVLCNAAGVVTGVAGRNGGRARQTSSTTTSATTTTTAAQATATTEAEADDEEE